MHSVSRKTYNRKPTSSGSALLELASVVWMLPIAILISVNTALVGFAAWMNDAACRDAARAAAQQKTAVDAQTAATQALTAFATQSAFTSNPSLLVGSPSFEYKVFPDQDGKPQLDKGPYVKVTTSMNVRLPAPLIFANAKFTDNLVFKQSYTFPILNPTESPDGASDVTNESANNPETTSTNELSSLP